MWEIYDKNKTYFDEEGQPFTWEKMSNVYPVSNYEKIIINCMGLTYTEYTTFNIAKSKYGALEYEDDENALLVINTNYSNEKSESTPIERIASALEYIELYLMKKEGLL